MKFPREFAEAWKQPNVKAAWFSETKPLRATDCENCGGSGFMSTFVGLSGPFDNVPVGKGVVAHFANGKWWGGSHFTAACPVCNGSGKAPDRTEQLKMPLRQYWEIMGATEMESGIEQPAADDEEAVTELREYAR
jgi:hypothetical protein